MQTNRKPLDRDMGKLNNKPQTDWETIGMLYRAGEMSVKAISRQFGVSDTAIKKKADALGWERNLTERVTERVATILAKQEAGLTSKAIPASQQDEAAIVEGAAMAVVTVVQEHKATVRKARNVVDRLLAEVEACTMHRDELQELIEEECAADADDSDAELRRKDARRRQLQKAIDMSSRVGSIRQLAAAVKDFVAIERQAFGLKDEAEKPAGDKMDEFLSALDTGGVQMIGKRSA